MRSTLTSFVADFRRLGRATAVVSEHGVRRRVTSYAELARLAGRFAALLEQRGTQPGDRVLLWGANGAEWIAALHGCMLRGALAVPLDAYGSAEFAARVCSDVRPVLVAGDAALLGQLPLACLGQATLAPLEHWRHLLPDHEAGPIAEIGADTAFQILFTSGTTGTPKGIVHTHGNVLASITPIEKEMAKYLRYERWVHPLRFLVTLPLSHVFGQFLGLWMPPLLGAEVHLEDRLVAGPMIERIRRERISVLAAVPRVLALLKTHLETAIPGLGERARAAQNFHAARRWWHFRDVHGLFGLKFWAMISGGGALPPDVERFWNALGFALIQGYGMTETSALITLNHPFRVAQGSLGKPLAGREVKLGPDGEVLVRGAMISTATWRDGALESRADDWLATGDLAKMGEQGDLRFVGRKSETIVLSSGVNIHPEDLEAALQAEPGVLGCAVLGIETPNGPEPCAVLAMRGGSAEAAAAVQSANSRLAPFQRMRRWLLWPEPDLPRTATGKVKRAALAEWVRNRISQDPIPAGNAQEMAYADQTIRAESFVEGSDGPDWLLDLVAGISGRHPATQADEAARNRLRLEEDLGLDSLGRAQLAAALEERLGATGNQDALDAASTLGELRRWTRQRDGGESLPAAAWSTHAPTPATSKVPTGRLPSQISHPLPGQANELARDKPSGQNHPPETGFVYPRWPWWPLAQALRVAFVELAMRPLVWLLAAPRVVAGPLSQTQPQSQEPMLIVANHTTAYDVALLLYALPASIRQRTAVAMAGEMLEDYRLGRNQSPALLNPLAPLAWLLMTALFNVFPLPRRRDFQRSFRHAGAALDKGFHVVLFPEGTRSPDGRMARFRPGIGLLAKQAGAPVLPMAIRGLGELKAGRKNWFRSGKIEVRVGQPLRFAWDASEASITAELRQAVARLLEPSTL